MNFAIYKTKTDMAGKAINRNFAILALAISGSVSAQTDTVVYRLTIDQKTVNKAGKNVTGMTINGSIPGPTLRFTEGDYAVLYVENKMAEGTSIHWHGLLLPNFQDGVPYLTTPPILPGKTLRYEFPLIQSGTYWYHSHTLLQEQSGVYGNIVIESKVKTLKYDDDLVLVISDWTNQKPLTCSPNCKSQYWLDPARICLASQNIPTLKLAALKNRYFADNLLPKSPKGNNQTLREFLQ